MFRVVVFRVVVFRVVGFLHTGPKYTSWRVHGGRTKHLGNMNREASVRKRAYTLNSRPWGVQGF